MVESILLDLHCLGVLASDSANEIERLVSRSPGFPYRAHPPPAAKSRGSFCDVGSFADCSSLE